MGRIRFSRRTESRCNRSARFCEVIVFRRIQVHAGHGVDPAQVVVHFLDALNVLRRDDGGRPRALLGNDAAQVSNAVLDDDAKPEWAPVLLLHGDDDAIADVIVIGGRVGNFPGQACDGL